MPTASRAANAIPDTYIVVLDDADLGKAKPETSSTRSRASIEQRSGTATRAGSTASRPRRPARSAATVEEPGRGPHRAGPNGQALATQSPAPSWCPNRIDQLLHYANAGADA